MTGEKIILENKTAQTVAFWHPTDSPIANLLFLPALGMPAGYYSNLGAAMAQRGLNTLLYEQRGHGEHPVKVTRHTDHSVRCWVEEDLPQLKSWLSGNRSHVPFIVAGHSLGAHAAACMLGLDPQFCDGFAAIAAAIPYPGHFEAKVAWQIRFLSRVVIPTTGAVLGYYPGDKIGFGGKEFKSLMQDWNHMAKTNTYQIAGIDKDIEAALSDVTCPILQVRLEHDDFAPPKGADSVTDKFVNSSVSKIEVSADELSDRADHFRWARQGDAVADKILQWWTKENAA